MSSADPNARPKWRSVGERPSPVAGHPKPNVVRSTAVRREHLRVSTRGAPAEPLGSSRALDAPTRFPACAAGRTRACGRSVSPRTVAGAWSVRAMGLADTRAPGVSILQSGHGSDEAALEFPHVLCRILRMSKDPLMLRPGGIGITADGLCLGTAPAKGL